MGSGHCYVLFAVVTAMHGCKWHHLPMGKAMALMVGQHGCEMQHEAWLI
jgi:hypothetical protein